MFKATATVSFLGVPDKETQAREIKAGDIITGELARSAVNGGQAIEGEHDLESLPPQEGENGGDGTRQKPGSAQGGAADDVEVPEDWESLSYNEMRALAKKIEPEGGAKKEEVIATISNYLAKKAEASANG